MTRESYATSLSLLSRARANEDTAWRQLVHLYGPLVQRWCRQAGLQPDDVADVFQETFHAVSRTLDRFKPSKSAASFRSWLKTIARSKIVDLLRRRERVGVAVGGTEAFRMMAATAEPQPCEAVEDDEDREDHALIVRRALDLIRPEFEARNWSSFLQVAIEGRSAADVARELEIAPQIVRQANYRIRRRLKKVLEDLVPPDLV